MRYNAPDTVYFAEARRLLSYGLKLLSKEKLMIMRGNFEFMRGITLVQMGLTVKVRRLKIYLHLASSNDGGWRCEKYP